MATKITLTNDPQRLSDGTKQVHVTVEKGSVFYYSVGTTKPTLPMSAGQMPHTCRDGVVNIDVGFSVWAWNPHGYDVVLALSSAT